MSGVISPRGGTGHVRGGLYADGVRGGVHMELSDLISKDALRLRGKRAKGKTTDERLLWSERSM